MLALALLLAALATPLPAAALLGRRGSSRLGGSGSLHALAGSMVLKQLDKHSEFWLLSRRQKHMTSLGGVSSNKSVQRLFVQAPSMKGPTPGASQIHHLLLEILEQSGLTH